MAQPTMADIAARVGVSRPLVSIVLRDVPGASAETRERVWRAARELGYTPHQAARSLRQTRSFQLGVTFDPVHASEPEVVESIYDAASLHGYQVILSARTSDRDQVSAVDELLSYRCAALVQVGSELSQRQSAALARRATVPIVRIAPGELNPDYDVVHSDGRSGIASVTQHLLQLGHRHLAYVHCPSLPDAPARLQGFRDVTEAGGSTARVVEVAGAGYTEEAGSEAARRLLADVPRPTALVAGNDQQAVGALWVLVRAGVDVPGEMSVAGYDDTRYARLSAVDLTTANADTVGLGRRAVAAAIRRIEQPGLAPEVFRIAPRLVVRGSTAAPPARTTSSTPRRAGRRDPAT